MKQYILIIMACALVVSCQPTKKEKIDGPLNVITTTGMIYDAVINIGKDKIQAQAIMGPGVDPHLYKATQGDLQSLQEADLILYNGLHLEGKMGEIFEKIAKIKNVKAVSQNISQDLFRESETYKGTYDPHIWFDVSLWSQTLETITTTLCELDSINTSFYQNNAQSYRAQLDSLHLAVKTEINSIPQEQRLLITAHDAFGYFGDAYGIEVNGLQGISTLSEPGLKDIANLVDLIVDRKIKAVFIETSVSEKAINAVVEGCKDKGHEVRIGGSLFSDAMGPFGEEEGTYIGMVNSNVQKIVNALK